MVALGTGAGAAQAQAEPHAGQVQLELRRLAVVGTALYVGAHPDDENTGVLATLALGRGLRTAYLSLTRGEGGQNLIGPEQGDLLGLIRTQELLGARRFDGAEQYFTRAVDFGYSKTPEESLRLWGHEEILADVVWIIRSLRPDVVITRFTSDGGGHGHHTASAVLAEEAFRAAADPSRFPEQLRHVRPWQARRLVWNRYDWGRPPGEAERSGDPSLDVGAYDPLLGKSYGELAALGRSAHKSQGMGNAARRGPAPNWFRHTAGEPAGADLFDGVDLGWSRFPSGAAVGEAVARAMNVFDARRPSASIPDLIEADRRIEALLSNPDLAGDPRIEHKRRELRQTIRHCAGLWLEALAERPTAAPGERLSVRIAAVNRSGARLVLKSVAVSPGATAERVDQPLNDNQPVTRTLEVALAPGAAPFEPHWLAGRARGALRDVSDPRLATLAEPPPSLTATFVVTAGEGSAGGPRDLAFEIPVQHRWADPVQGERTRDFAVVPAVSVSLADRVVVLLGSDPKEVRATVTAQTTSASGSLRLRPPAGWSVQPSETPFALERAGASTSLTFTLSAGPSAANGPLAAEARVSGQAVSSSVILLDYAHFPPQSALEPAEAALVRLDGAPLDLSIGYVMGSGDETPRALEQLGCRVSLLSDEDLTQGALERFDVIMTGVRAHNTRGALATAAPRLRAYVERGGTLIVQYNTVSYNPQQSLKADALGPFPITLSRERVSVEEAPVEILLPRHPLLARPYPIAQADFAGWVQERGLYFPSEWDARYEALLACADPGEEPRAGGLLFARVGRGAYVHTSYSWFRQLPAGVPGAYRILSNLVSAGRHAARVERSQAERR